MKFICVSFVFFICFTSLKAGGGWPQPKGKLFYKLGYWTVSADQHFDQNAVITKNPKTTISNSFVYAEYGITSKLTGVVYFPFYANAKQELGNSASFDSFSSIGDADVSLSYNLLNKSVVLSMGITAGLPLGNANGGSFGTLQTGDGEFNQMIFAETGTGLKILNINGYATAKLAYNHKEETYSDEFHAGIKIGFKFLKEKLGVSLGLYSVTPLDDDASYPINSVSIYSNKTKYFAFTPEVYYKFNEKIGVSVSMGGASLSSENILARPSFSFGVFGNL